MLVSVRAAGLTRTPRAFPSKVEEKSQRSRLMIPSGAKEKRAASAIPLRREGSRAALTSVRLLAAGAVTRPERSTSGATQRREAQ